MARSVTSQLIMELLDRVTGPARKVAGSVRGMNRTVRESAGAQATMADRIAASQARTQVALDRARIGVMETIGTYYLLKDAVTAPFRAAAAFETQLEAIGQKAGIPVENLGALGERIKAVARDTNQATSNIASAVDALVGRGADTDVAMAAAAPIGKAATAYRASTEDLAAASWAAVDNLKVPADQIGTALDMMAAAGKEGAFELRDQAQYFPALGAAYQALGQEGTDAVADLAAAMQVVRKGTGDSSSAATNLANVMQKIYAPATVKKFGEKNIDIYKAMEKAAKRGLTPIEAIAEITEEALKGDLSKMGDLFEDAQVQAGLRAIIQNKEEYRRIRDEALKAQGVVDADYERRVKTAAGATERWKASIENLNISLGNAMLPVLNDVLDKVIPIIDKIGEWTAANPELAANIMTAVAALIAFKGALSVLSFVGLTGKAGALSLLGAAFGSVGREAGAAATAVESSVARQNAAIRRLNLKALGAGVLGFLAMQKAPTDPAQLQEFQEGNRKGIVDFARSLPIVGDMVPEYDPKAEEDARRESNFNLPMAVNEQNLASAEAALAAAAKIPELRAKQDELLAKIQETGSDFASGFDPASQALSQQLLEVQTELETAETDAAGVKAALAAIGMENVAINVETGDLDMAIAKVKHLIELQRQARAAWQAGGVSTIISGAGGASPVKGPRAKGGPVSRGGVYLVGEEGPELM
ncbi:MAG: phage tail tape measure protein, partial [Desulfurellales bacterium]